MSRLTLRAQLAASQENADRWRRAMLVEQERHEAIAKAGDALAAAAAIWPDHMTDKAKFLLRQKLLEYHAARGSYPPS